MFGMLCLLAVAALWGSSSPVVKFLISQPTPPSAALLTASQALLAAAFLLAGTLGSGAGATTVPRREGKAGGGGAGAGSLASRALRLGLGRVLVGGLGLRLGSVLRAGAAAWRGLRAGGRRGGRREALFPTKLPLHSGPQYRDDDHVDHHHHHHDDDEGPGGGGGGPELDSRREPPLQPVRSGSLSRQLHHQQQQQHQEQQQQLRHVGDGGSGDVSDDVGDEGGRGGGGLAAVPGPEGRGGGGRCGSEGPQPPPLQPSLSKVMAAAPLGQADGGAPVGAGGGGGGGGLGGRLWRPNLLAVPLGSLAAVGLELGTYNFCASALGTWGVQRISATKAAFLGQATSLITPLLVALSGQRVAAVVWAACGCGVLGATLVALDGSGRAAAAVGAVAGAATRGSAAAGSHLAALMDGLTPPLLLAAGAGTGAGAGGQSGAVSRAMRLETADGGGGGGGGGVLAAAVAAAAAAVAPPRVSVWVRHSLPPAVSQESMGASFWGGPAGSPGGGQSVAAVVGALLRDNASLAMLVWVGLGPGALSSVKR